ncbi:alpha/beta hydrolase family protein [Paenibacillus radicibacter]|uniref:alpha/beta hydrolase family protein n=1 Tax=Paenibacillus radicibacter TaxID=2972488 RepID=UPI002159AE23|nr:alpha/beta fold hydrolase [Paenibacillus radicibacter]
MKKRFNMIHKMVVASLATTLLLAPIASAAEQEMVTISSEKKTSSSDHRLVPVRIMSETIGAGVKWNGLAKSVTVTKGDTQIIFTVGESDALVNNKATSLGAKVEYKDGMVYVPQSILQNALESKISWNADSNQVVVASGDLEVTASQFVHAMLKADVENIRALMNDKLKASTQATLLAGIGKSYQGLYGQINEQLTASTSKNAVHENVVLTYKAQGIPFQITIRFDNKGLVDDVFIPYTSDTGLYQKPSYDDPKLYTEKEVVVGEGDLALPGTLTLPVGKTNVPVVVLVHGSGPNDRDESALSLKPFRDLAVGLAAQGVAVLRYEKVTREHTLQSSAAAKGKFTVKEETIDDAIRAVQAVKKIEGIDTKKIIVVGHSQGGMLIPRIIEADKNQDIAKAVIIAGPATSLEDIMIEQSEYGIESLKQLGQSTASMEQQLEMMKQQVALIKDPAYSTSKLPEGFMLGNPYWWLDFRNYSGPAIAKNQKTPLLIMQGENDSQVLAHHLDAWKKGLANRSDVTYASYPKVNHFLVEAEGRSTGVEYSQPANVSEAIINDIVKFVKK